MSDPVGPPDGRTFAGWKLTGGIIAAIVVVVVALNAAGESTIDRTPRPSATPTAR